jgi:hypothetical protein
MTFPIGTNIEGELYARSGAKCVRVWQLSALLGDGMTEERLEGLGYCPLSKRFPGCTIQGDPQPADILYTVTLDRLL